MAISLRTPSQNGGKRGVAASAVSVDYILRKPRVPRIKSAPPHWDSHLTHSSLGLASLLLSNASRSVNPFSRSSPLYPRDIHTDHSASDTIRYEMLFERAFNSYISQLNLPHGAKKNKKWKRTRVSAVSYCLCVLSTYSLCSLCSIMFIRRK